MVYHRLRFCDLKGNTMEHKLSFLTQQIRGSILYTLLITDGDFDYLIEIAFARFPHCTILFKRKLQ